MKLDKVIAVRTNKTVYRDGDLAVKVFDSDYSKADVLNEALNHARAEETALNVPTLQEVAKVDQKWAIVSDFVEGKTLAQLMAENPDQKARYMEQLELDTYMGEIKFENTINRLTAAANPRQIERVPAGTASGK